MEKTLKTGGSVSSSSACNCRSSEKFAKELVTECSAAVKRLSDLLVQTGVIPMASPTEAKENPSDLPLVHSICEQHKRLHERVDELNDLIDHLETFIGG